MKQKKPIKRYVSAKALEHLNACLKNDETKPDFAYKIEVFYYFLDIFYRLQTFNKDLLIKNSGYQAVSSNYFKAIIDDGSYRKYLYYLKKIGILLIDEHYEQKESKGYSYNPLYESSLVTVLITPDMPLWKKIVSHANRKRKHRAKEPHIKALEKRLREVRIDMAAADEYLVKLIEKGFINQNLYNSRVLSISRVNDGDFFFSRNNTNGRVDHNLTNMKRELRNYIVGGYSQIDLRNSQPYLFNLIMTLYISYCSEDKCINPLYPFIYRLFKQIIKCPFLDEKEVEKYHKWTLTGDIYNLFMQEYGIERDEAKELFLAALYASNNSQMYKKEIKLFNQVFPTIGRFIREVKRKDYALLAVTMQRLESFIFIDNIAKRLVEAGIVPLTVHDAVIVKDEEVERAQVIINEVFMEFFNELPAFKITSLSPGSEEIKNSLQVKPIVKVRKKSRRTICKEAWVDRQMEYADYMESLLRMQEENPLADLNDEQLSKYREFVFAA